MKHPVTFMFLVLLMVACQEVGTTITKRQTVTEHRASDDPTAPFVRETVTETEVELPANNKDESNVTIDPETSATVGASYPPPQPDPVAEKQTEIATYASILLGVLAVALFVGHRYFPLIPTQAPMGIGILAGILYAAPTVMDRYSGYIFAGAAVWATWTIYSAKHNHKLKQTPVQET